jgi:hypothetical protein
MIFDKQYYIFFYKSVHWNTKDILTMCKKSLEIPKGQSESVYRRRTDNTMAKRKSTKGQTTIWDTLVPCEWYRTIVSLWFLYMNSHGSTPNWNLNALQQIRIFTWVLCIQLFVQPQLRYALQETIYSKMCYNRKIESKSETDYSSVSLAWY